MLLTLPIEIIRQIVENVIGRLNGLTYPNHIWDLSLSCRLLRDEAQRILFRNPHIHPVDSRVYNQTMTFFDAISSSPDRLALYVKSLNVFYVCWPPPNSNQITQFIQKFSSALRAMHNLKSLEVSDPNHGIGLLPSVLDGVHFKLTSFGWTGCRQVVSYAANIKASFLLHQDEIEDLVLSGFIDERTLQPIAANICPRLRALSAPYSVARLILPKKKHLTFLQWIPPEGEHTNPQTFDLDLISTELGNIMELSYGSRHTQVLPMLKDVAPYLKSLVHLKTGRQDIQLEALAQLPHLKVLVMTREYSYDFPKEDEVTAIAAACKSLERILVKGGGIGKVSAIELSKIR